MPKVAVEGSLKQVRKMLRDNGYDVVDYGNWQQMVDAVVITGMNESVLSERQEKIGGAPIINADGLTVNEVFHAVHERLSPMEHR